MEGFNSIQRYEIKYTIPNHLIDDIILFIKPYCKMDKNTKISEGFYTVNSLYYDSMNYTLFNQRINGKNNRYNVRARFYNKKSGQIVNHLELKQKNGLISTKYRVTLKKKNYPKCLTSLKKRTLAKKKSAKKNLDMIRTAVQCYNLEPKLLCQYDRMAFVSVVNDYARVTIDKNLKAALCTNYIPKDEYKNFVNYGSDSSFDMGNDSGNSAVLELKCYPTQVPLWFIDMVKKFELINRPFSKYVFGLRACLGQTKLNFPIDDRQDNLSVF